jgi:tRNA nucleotidyltransferase (CCA-adding enzyme)
LKTYRVGGSVRDELLGLPVQDHDHVVVGSSPEEMVRQGFRPVGADFPVFLHPETHEEYALARTERKTAPGYKGFVFHADASVTLEEDLRRRDLTINAMARADDGALVDPYGGEKDLRSGILRHVSEAFGEDPVRILRVARFAARFGFAVAPETLALLRRMVASGEADALVPERVWQELSRGLMEKSPSRMIAVLRECGALARVLPEIDASFSQPDVPERLAARLDHAASRGFALPVRYALLVLDLDEARAEALAARVNAPGECRELARLAIRERAEAVRPDLDADATLSILERTDAFRRALRLESLLDVLEADCHSHAGKAGPARAHFARALEAARAVDAGAVVRENPTGIAEALRRARLVAIAALQPPTGN